MITKFPPKNFRENFPSKVSAEITVINLAWIFRWFFGENGIQSKNFGQKNFWQKNSQVFFPTENFIIGNSGPGMKFYPESWFLTSIFYNLVWIMRNWSFGTSFGTAKGIERILNELEYVHYPSWPGVIQGHPGGKI